MLAVTAREILTSEMIGPVVGLLLASGILCLWVLIWGSMLCSPPGTS